MALFTHRRSHFFWLLIFIAILFISGRGISKHQEETVYQEAYFYGMSQLLKNEEPVEKASTSEDLLSMESHFWGIQTN